MEPNVKGNGSLLGFHCFNYMHSAAVALFVFLLASKYVPLPVVYEAG